MELILFAYKNFRFMILHSHFLCPFWRSHSPGWCRAGGTITDSRATAEEWEEVVVEAPHGGRATSYYYNKPRAKAQAKESPRDLLHSTGAKSAKVASHPVSHPASGKSLICCVLYLPWGYETRYR